MPRRGKLELAVIRASKVVPLLPADAAAVALARLYAAEIDSNPHMLGQLGGALRTMLQELGLSPRARRGVFHGATPTAVPPSKLEELRSARERRGRA